MLERVIENWLDKSSELSFQTPFCYMLSAEGHTIIHLTRHCGMEMGKDIITISPKGTPCAYQLKGAINGRFTLSQWRKINTQVFDLVVGSIEHPSITNKKHHRSFLVINGVLEEEVSRAIADMNRNWSKNKQSHLKLETIVRGEILDKAKKLESNFWPTELSDVKLFLELYLNNGDGVLPKGKLSSLLEQTLPLELVKGKKKPSRAHCERAIASAAVLLSIAISSFTRQRNYVAEIEAWIIYICYVFALIEKWNMPFDLCKNEFGIASKSIYNSLSILCEELMERKHFVQGDAFVDQPVYKVRMTWLIDLPPDNWTN